MNFDVPKYFILTLPYYWIITKSLDKNLILSTGPKRRDGAMENLDFENFFGSSVAIHDGKAVSCAYREQPKYKSYESMRSTMGENIFFHL